MTSLASLPVPKFFSRFKRGKPPLPETLSDKPLSPNTDLHVQFDIPKHASGARRPSFAKKMKDALMNLSPFSSRRSSRASQSTFQSADRATMASEAYEEQPRRNTDPTYQMLSDDDVHEPINFPICEQQEEVATFETAAEIETASPVDEVKEEHEFAWSELPEPENNLGEELKTTTDFLFNDTFSPFVEAETLNTDFFLNAPFPFNPVELGKYNAVECSEAESEGKDKGLADILLPFAEDEVGLFYSQLTEFENPLVYNHLTEFEDSRVYSQNARFEEPLIYSELRDEEETQFNFQLTEPLDSIPHTEDEDLVYSQLKGFENLNISETTRDGEQLSTSQLTEIPVHSQLTKDEPSIPLKKETDPMNFSPLTKDEDPMFYSPLTKYVDYDCTLDPDERMKIPSPDLGVSLKEVSSVVGDLFKNASAAIYDVIVDDYDDDDERPILAMTKVRDLKELLDELSKDCLPSVPSQRKRAHSKSLFHRSVKQRFLSCMEARQHRARVRQLKKLAKCL